MRAPMYNQQMSQQQQQQQQFGMPQHRQIPPQLLVTEENIEDWVLKLPPSYPRDKLMTFPMAQRVQKIQQYIIDWHQKRLQM